MEIITHDHGGSLAGTHSQSSNSSQERWVPILDYAVLTGMSTSTLRRYIKANKVKFKIEEGRYLILADPEVARKFAERQKRPVFTSPLETSNRNMPQTTSSPAQVEDQQRLLKKMQELEQKVSRAEEQISELKMLIAIYEEKIL